jgi:hypothetical protein
VFWRILHPRAEYDREALRPHRIAQRLRRVAGQADAPEARLRHLVQRAGEVDDTDPRHGLERAGCRAGHRAAFRRGVAILRDEAERVEGSGRAQDRAQIVRVGDLVEDTSGR